MHWIWKTFVSAAVLSTVVALAAVIIVAVLLPSGPSFKQTPSREGHKQSTSQSEVPLVGVEAEEEHEKTPPSTGAEGQSDMFVSDKEYSSLKGSECLTEAKAPGGPLRRCTHPSSLPTLHESCDPGDQAFCDVGLRCSRSTLSCEPALMLGEDCNPRDENMCASAVCRQRRRTLASTQISALENAKDVVHGYAAAEEHDTAIEGEYICQRLVTCGQPCDAEFDSCHGRCSVCGAAGVCAPPLSENNQLALTSISEMPLPDKDSDDRPAGPGVVLQMRKTCGNNSGKTAQEGDVVEGQHGTPQEEEEEARGVPGGEDGNSQHTFKDDLETEAGERGTQLNTAEGEVREHNHKKEGNKSSHTAEGTQTDLRNATEEQEGNKREQSQQRDARGWQGPYTSSGNSTILFEEGSTTSATRDGHNKEGETRNFEGLHKQLADQLGSNSSESGEFPIGLLPLLRHPSLHVQKQRRREDGDGKDEPEMESARPAQLPPQLVQRFSQPSCMSESVAVTADADIKDAGSPPDQPLPEATATSVQPALSFSDYATNDAIIHQSPTTQLHAPAVGAKPGVSVLLDASQLENPENEHGSDGGQMALPQIVTSWSGADAVHALATSSINPSSKAGFSHGPAQRRSSQERDFQLLEPYMQRSQDGQKVQQNLFSRQHQHDANKAKAARNYVRSQRSAQQVPARHSKAAGQDQTTRERPCTSASCDRLQQFSMIHRPHEGKVLLPEGPQKPEWPSAQISIGNPQRKVVSQGPAVRMPWGYGGTRDAWQGERQLPMQQQLGDKLFQYRQGIQHTSGRQVAEKVLAHQTSPRTKSQRLWPLLQKYPQVAQPLLKGSSWWLEQHQQPAERQLQHDGATSRSHPRAKMMPTEQRNFPRVKNPLQQQQFLAASGLHGGDIHHRLKREAYRSRRGQEHPGVREIARSTTYTKDNEWLWNKTLKSLYDAKKEIIGRFDALVQGFPSAEKPSITKRTHPSEHERVLGTAAAPDFLPSNFHPLITLLAAPRDFPLLDKYVSVLASLPTHDSKRGTSISTKSRRISSYRED